MTLSTDAQNAEVIVTPLTDEIDVATGDVLARQMQRARALHPDRVIVDFGAVTFCDSTAISVLMSARSALEAQGCAMVIRDPPRLLQQVAHILGTRRASASLRTLVPLPLMGRHSPERSRTLVVPRSVPDSCLQGRSAVLASRRL